MSHILDSFAVDMSFGDNAVATEWWIQMDLNDLGPAKHPAFICRHLVINCRIVINFGGFA